LLSREGDNKSRAEDLWPQLGWILRIPDMYCPEYPRGYSDH